MAVFILTRRRSVTVQSVLPPAPYSDSQVSSRRYFSHFTAVPRAYLYKLQFISKVFFSKLKMYDEKLIELVRNYPVLYDLSNPKYMDTDFKNNIWSKIGEEMKTTGK